MFGSLPGVEAIALAGSLAAGAVDLDSDIDLYVYTVSYTHLTLPTNKTV